MLPPFEPQGPDFDPLAYIKSHAESGVEKIKEGIQEAKEFFSPSPSQAPKPEPFSTPFMTSAPVAPPEVGSAEPVAAPELHEINLQETAPPPASAPPLAKKNMFERFGEMIGLRTQIKNLKIMCNDFANIAKSAFQAVRKRESAILLAEMKPGGFTRPQMQAKREVVTDPSFHSSRDARSLVLTNKVLFAFAPGNKPQTNTLFYKSEQGNLIEKKITFQPDGKIKVDNTIYASLADFKLTQFVSKETQNRYLAMANFARSLKQLKGYKFDSDTGEIKVPAKQVTLQLKFEDDGKIKIGNKTFDKTQDAVTFAKQSVNNVSILQNEFANRLKNDKNYSFDPAGGWVKNANLDFAKINITPDGYIRMTKGSVDKDDYVDIAVDNAKAAAEIAKWLVDTKDAAEILQKISINTDGTITFKPFTLLKYDSPVFYNIRYADKAVRWLDEEDTLGLDDQVKVDFISGFEALEKVRSSSPPQT